MYDTKNLQSKQDFMKFLESLIDHYHKNSSEWENATLEDFLSAMLSWVEDAEGYYKNIGELDVINNPSWRLFSDILIASSMYE